MDDDATFLREMLDELNLNQSRLAARMSGLGDNRSLDAILRGIQRVANREARMSGELRVVISLLKREQLRYAQRALGLGWVVTQDGSIATRLEGFDITISPQTKGRWSINLVHVSSQYSPPWPQWEVGIDNAKQRAMRALDEALEDPEWNREAEPKSS